MQLQQCRNLLNHPSCLNTCIDWLMQCSIALPSVYSSDIPMINHLFRLIAILELRLVSSLCGWNFGTKVLNACFDGSKYKIIPQINYFRNMNSKYFPCYKNTDVIL